MITQSELKTYFHYEPETGNLTRIKATTNRVCIGSIAGTVNTQKNGKSYIEVSVNYKRYLAHRLIWLYVHGFFPDDKIYHIDGCGTNNKLSNLRSVSVKENNKNRRMQSNNTSGVNGVHWKRRLSL